MSANVWICPACASYATRIHRRLIDRVISLIIPVHRYRCHNYQCQWQGNVKQNALQHFDKDI